MTEREALKLALEALENNKQKHHYCEDTWYSCPKHEDGCANEAEGDECNCGADEINAQFDKAITAIKEALAEQCVCGEPNSAGTHRTDGPCLAPQPEQEPDWKGLVLGHNEDCDSRCDMDRCGYKPYYEYNGRRCPDCPVHEKIYVEYTPPQRTWVGLSVFEINDLVENTDSEDYRNLVERTEAKIKDKNGYDS